MPDRVRPSDEAEDSLDDSLQVDHAERLLTRDRGFYRSSFTELTILDPTRPTET